MDSGERAKIINQILNELMILRSYTYGMYRAMYFAQMKGLMKALNPFQGYINLDLQIANDIVRKRKILD
jgi:phage-related protein